MVCDEKNFCDMNDACNCVCYNCDMCLIVCLCEH